MVFFPWGKDTVRSTSLSSTPSVSRCVRVALLARDSGRGHVLDPGDEPRATRSECGDARRDDAAILYRREGYVGGKPQPTSPA